MKKIFLLAATGFVTLTACRKDYTCHCQNTSGAVTVYKDSTFRDVTKSNADSKCSNLQVAYGNSVNCSVQQ